MGETEALDPAQELELHFLARQKPMHEATARGNSAIQQFYNGQNVFVTGGTGFLGKQLIEKMFRATNVSKVFVLLRPKKGKAVELRINELLQDPVFDWVKEHKPKSLNKIVPIAGDVAEMRLGISDKDWKMLAEEINIIFHMAATTRFDETLRVATMINVRGAREALILGKACKQLKSYVHVSTAYSYACDNLIDTEVLEDFYKSPIDPDTLIKMTETVDETRLNSITPSLIKNWPNTYSFGKAVAEETVKNMCEGLPLCVVRPAIVICAMKEPSPGWLDMSNVYGASGVSILNPYYPSLPKLLFLERRQMFCRHPDYKGLEVHSVLRVQLLDLQSQNHLFQIDQEGTFERQSKYNNINNVSLSVSPLVALFARSKV